MGNTPIPRFQEILTQPEASAKEFIQKMAFKPRTNRITTDKTFKHKGMTFTPWVGVLRLVS
jgi:hypothetical protein